MGSPLEQAGCWFLRSGIQEPSGGVARYFHTDTNRNAPVSTEITGYAASTFAYLHARTGREEFLEAGRRAAHYLAHDAWDEQSHTIAFEPQSPHAYFFDLGIIARGLRAAGEIFRSRARDVTMSMAFDFLGGEGDQRLFHPIITLPEKQPLDYEPRWSREPGCYQLKSALAWLPDVTDDPEGRPLFDTVLAYSLATHESFLAVDCPREKMMDRLHAYCYFLEALLFVKQESALAWGIERVAKLLREIASEFERSDVCAQLLRVRLIAHHQGLVALDESAASEEAARAAAYQDQSAQYQTGGYWFGRKHGELLPYLNPVSTAFCMQALDLFEMHRARNWQFDLRQLI